MEFVEVKGRTVDVAVEAALAELGIASADKAEIEVLQQPERGFLGLGGREAIVRVRAKREDTSSKKRRSRKPRSSTSGSGGRKDSGTEQAAAIERCREVRRATQSRLGNGAELRQEPSGPRIEPTRAKSRVRAEK